MTGDPWKKDTYLNMPLRYTKGVSALNVAGIHPLQGPERLGNFLDKRSDDPGCQGNADLVQQNSAMPVIPAALNFFGQDQPALGIAIIRSGRLSLRHSHVETLGQA